MPHNCPCCRALEEIEDTVFRIEELTSSYLSRLERFTPRGNLVERERLGRLENEYRREIGNIVNRIVRISREARDA